MSDAPTPSDHERSDGGSPANLFTHGRTGQELHDTPETPSAAEDAKDAEDDGAGER